MRKFVIDRVRRILNRSFHDPRHTYFLSSSSSSHSRFLSSSLPNSSPMASDSTFPITAQNINPKVFISFFSWIVIQFLNLELFDWVWVYGVMQIISMFDWVLLWFLLIGYAFLFFFLFWGWYESLSWWYQLFFSPLDGLISEICNLGLTFL